MLHRLGAGVEVGTLISFVHKSHLRELRRRPAPLRSARSRTILSRRSPSTTFAGCPPTPSEQYPFTPADEASMSSSRRVVASCARWALWLPSAVMHNCTVCGAAMAPGETVCRHCGRAHYGPVCGACQQPAPTLVRGGKAICSACGATRGPLSGVPLNMAGQAHRVGSVVTSVFAWAVVLGGPRGGRARGPGGEPHRHLRGRERVVGRRRGAAPRGPRRRRGRDAHEGQPQAR